MHLSQVKFLIPESTRGKGRLAALSGGILLSFDAVFIRLSGVGGFDTVFLFGLFSALSMALLIQATDPRGLAGTLRADGWPVLVSALLLVGSASSFVLSVKYTTIANTAFIMSSRPVVTALLSWLILKERTTKSLWLAIAGVMAGISIVVSGSLQSGDLTGDVLAVFTVLCLGFNGTLWRRYKDISRPAVVGLGGLFIALVMFIPAQPAAYSWETWLIMAAMGMLSAPLGRVLNALSARYIPAAEMATITLINVVLAPAWAFLFFAEQPPVATMIGGSVILLSIGSYLFLTGKKTVLKPLQPATEAGV